MAQNAQIVIVVDSNASGAVSGLNATAKAIGNVQSQGKKAASATGQFGTAMQLLTTPIATLGVGLRQMGQALQGVSFLATAFVSIPIVAAFREAANAAIEFDAALVRAQKTTGLADSAIGRLTGQAGTLSGELRQLAQNVATPIEDLANLAEQAGQLGVRDVGNIMKFVRVAEIMGQTTDIAANEALEAFGRLTRALGVETSDAATYMLQLANAVNMLENTTTASANDIVDGMRNAISAASGFNIAGADLAAFIASMYDMGVGALESGTMFSRMAGYVTTKADELAAMVGKSVQEVRQAFDDDFVGGLLGVVEAIGNVESESEQMAIASELFGQRAARGVILLANQYDQLVERIGSTREEFNSGTSIIDEYVKAMSSTQAQIGVMVNNLKVLGVTLGDTFLPIVNVILKYLVPAIQIATEEFAKLTQPVRVAIVAGAAFLAILGPLAMVLGTLAFSLGIAITGVLNLIAAFGATASAILPVFAAIATAASALIGVSFIARDAMEGVRDTILSYAQAARSWGNNLVSNLAAGMLEGMAAVINAAISIANAIAQFLASFSPPKKGPLREILNWGRNLIETYIEGFKEADFSAINDVTSTIGRYLRNLGKLGIIDEQDVIPAILDVRHAFTELIDTFNKTGEISDTVLQRIASNMGEMGDKIAEYLELQLRVNAAQQVYDEAIRKLEKIRDLREEVNNTYKREVREIQKSGKPLLDQLSAIVDARYERDEALVSLDDEETQQKKVVSETEAQLDVLKDQLGTHEGLIDYYLDELDLLAEQKGLMDKVGGAAGGAAKAAGEFANALKGIDLTGGIGKFDEVLGNWDDLLAGLDDSIVQFADGRRVIEAFFAGLRGEYLSDNPELLANVTPEITNAIAFGRELRGIFDEAVRVVTEFVDEVKRKLGELQDIDLAEAFSPLGGLAGYVPGILAVASALAVFVALVKTFGLSIGGLALFENVQAAILGFGATVKIAAGDLGAFISLASPFIGKFLLIGAIVGAVVGGIIYSLGFLKDQAAAAFAGITASLQENGIGEALGNLGAAFADLWAAISPILLGVVQLVIWAASIVIKTLAGIIGAAITPLINTLAGVINIIAGILGAVVNLFRAGWALITGDTEAFRTAITGIIGGVATAIQGIMQTIAQVVLTGVGAVVGGIASLIQSVLDILGIGGGDIAAKVTTVFATMSTDVNTWIGKAKGTIADFFTGAWAGTDVFSGAVDEAATNVESGASRMTAALDGVAGGTQALGTNATQPLFNLGSGFLGLEQTGTGALTTLGGSFGTFIQGLQNSGGEANGIFEGIALSAEGMATSVSRPLDDSQTRFDQYNRAVNGVAQEVGGSLETLGGKAAGLEALFSDPLSAIQTDFSELEANSGLSIDNIITSSESLGVSATELQTQYDTSFTDINTTFNDFEQNTSTVRTNVEQYIDSIITKIGSLVETVASQFPVIQEWWNTLEAHIETAVTNIAGEGGLFELFANTIIDLRTQAVGDLSAISSGVDDLESNLDSSVTNMIADLDRLLEKFRDVADESVNHSIIPDMNAKIMASFDEMISHTTDAVSGWSGTITSEFSGVTPATAMMAPSTNTVAIGGDGPLVEIRNLVVPNAQVGQQFAKSISEELSRLVSYRKVPG